MSSFEILVRRLYNAFFANYIQALLLKRQPWLKLQTNWSVCDHFIFPSYENSFLFIAQILCRLLGQLIFLSYYSVEIVIWASDIPY